jgi:energy-coupling factor transport system permease protein
VILPLAAWSGVARSVLSASVKIAVPLAISLLLIQGFFAPGETILLRIGPLRYKLEGLLLALQTLGRILGVMSSFLLLSFTVRSDRLMLALQERGMSPTITYIVLATIQIVPRFRAKANTILDAQRSRGLETEGSLRRRILSLTPLVVPLLLGSIIDIEERAMALDARAFSRPGPKTSLTLLPDSAAQRAVRLLLLLAMLGVVALAVWLWRR